MTVSTTGRFGFKTYGAGTDPYPTRVEFNAQQNLLDANSAMFAQGATTARPAAGKSGRFYWDSTVSRLYYDDGAAWSEVSTNGGGGAGKPITPNTAGVEGTSSRSARADHTHNLPLATASADGAMPATDKALLNSASATATPSTLVKLDGSGRAQIADPSVAAEIANKRYVDAQRDTRAASSHEHDAADVTSGTFDVARLPVVTVAAAGAMLAADKLKLDNAVAAATAARLVMRDAAGRAQFADPLAAADAATKSYVDGQIGTRAPSVHTHSYSSLTGLPSTFASDWGTLSNKPAIFPSDWANVAGKPATFAPSAHTHAYSSLTGIPATFAPSAHEHAWGDLNGVPATFAPSAHTHPWADVTGKPATFAPTLGYTATTAKPGSWRPDWSEVDNKPVLVSLAYADGHYAAISDLNGKLNASAFSDRIGAGSTYTQIHSAGKLGVATFYDSGVAQIQSVYSNNVGDSSAYRSVWVDAGGYLGYNLSSEKYKTNIKPYSVPLDVLSKIEPKLYQIKSGIEKVGADAAPWRVNFIAEDLFDNGLLEYVSFDGKGEARENVETINEQLMVNALWSFARQQQEIIEQMRAELDELAGR
ncbi:minor tail protein [Arthrobacter phage Abba]|uniref:Minor tail protein n=1 Tax=Arthrobacter phage Abba TaxID=2713256 RepID=A0A6G8R2D7_9CAUD|nr:minor tail protein [Arthrobacter phage Abba]QIN94352.1 minor tail protein [Arthrobacter phage Abba]